MINIKNIFITTGISVLFGFYSIYNILEYINGIDRLYMHRISELQIKLDESTNKYKSLEFDYMIINTELIKLHDRVKELEEKNEILDTFFNSDNSVDATNEENNIFNDEIICDEYCDLNNMIPKTRKDTMSSIDIINNIFETNKLETETDVLDMSCVEIINEVNTNSLKISSCSSRHNSFSNTESSRVTSRPRSISVTEVNWAGLTKKFLFG